MPGIQHYTVSASYDDAVALDAYLAMHTGWGDVRAERIGNALVNAWAHSRRLFDDYAPGGLGHPGDAQIAGHASSTGDMAWAGLALAQLYSATGMRSYLDGAMAIGNWIYAHCRAIAGPAGTPAGILGRGADRMEVNRAQYRRVRVLPAAGQAHRRSGLASGSAWARRFIVAMWDWPPGQFDIGTLANGVTPNDVTQAEDVNSWSYLALRDPGYAASISWDVRNLDSHAGRFNGVSVSTCDRGGVWFEGTAHLADALE